MMNSLKLLVNPGHIEFKVYYDGLQWFDYTSGIFFSYRMQKFKGPEF